MKTCYTPDQKKNGVQASDSLSLSANGYGWLVDGGQVDTNKTFSTAENNARLLP